MSDSFEKVSFVGKFFQKGVNNVVGPNRNTGTFVKDVRNHTIDPESVSVIKFTPEEIKEREKWDDIQQGVGGIVGDASFGLGKMLSPQHVKEKLNNGLSSMKEGIRKVDTWAATPIAGKDAGSWRGKFFSKPVGKDGRGTLVGEVRDKETGEVIDHLYRGSGGESRRASLLAPVSNTTKVTTPFLAAMYVGDKMYGEGQVNNNLNQTAIDYVNKLPEDDLGKEAENISSGEEKHGILEEEYLALQMDKQASLQKIAYLEEELEKYAAETETLKEEVELLTKEASWEREQKVTIQNHLNSTKQTLLEKQAEYEEFRLRTIARQRSEAAVKTAEKMLEVGMIKQAEFDEQVDKLMDCDDTTFNLYTSLVKEAKKDEEGLETLAFLVDYRSNDTDSAPIVSERGISKRGQSIGQAARDLIK